MAVSNVQPPVEPDLSDFVRAMPKAEVHIHLEGAIAPATVLELARRHNRLDRLPAQDVAGLQRWFTFTDFPHFIHIYMIIQDLLRSAEDFALIVERCGDDMAAQGIRYRELTVTPFTHTHLQREKGVTIDHILDGLEMGRQRAKARHGVEMRWVFDIPRNASFPSPNSLAYDPEPAKITLSQALAGRDRGVVGFGLGGFEVGAPPAPFAHAFAEAKEAGLLSVPHAGETLGPESVWGAIHALGADRIGHGVRAVEDPRLLAYLADCQIPLEVNPTSNVRLHIYPSAEQHPFPHLDRMGLLLTVNSDDPPLFNTTLCQEYELLATVFGYGRADLLRIARNAFAVAGVDARLKADLLAEFDTWVIDAQESDTWVKGSR